MENPYPKKWGRTNFRIAEAEKMLEKESYAKVAKKLGVSTTTLHRVMSGYKKVKI